MEKVNYEKIMQKKIQEIEKYGVRPKLLLHICCAPCSSGVIEELFNYFDITVFFYNPNISYKEEYLKRIEELNRFITKKELKIKILEGRYDPQKDFFEKVKGLEKEKEGGKRCYECYKLRLDETAKVAKENGFDYFTTVLSISPLKNATWINEIGKELQDKYDIEFLYSDFKKKGRYQKSIVESKKYELYRQDYCGCIFSKLEREEYKKEKEENN